MPKGFMKLRHPREHGHLALVAADLPVGEARGFLGSPPATFLAHRVETAPKALLPQYQRHAVLKEYCA